MIPIYVAIDTPDRARANALAESLRDTGCGLKLGLEFFAAHGPEGVAEIARAGLPLFLDLKLHDIPNTVGKTIAALRPIEPAVLTVHAAGGRAMLEAAKAAASPSTRLVAVTVLTSLDADDLRATGVNDVPAGQVDRLAGLARAAGLDGIVCSGAEVGAARAAWPAGFLVVPGVRPQGSGEADQKRVVTPRAAMESGASMLVIGRPITESGDPAAAFRRIADTLRG